MVVLVLLKATSKPCPLSPNDRGSNPCKSQARYNPFGVSQSCLVCVATVLAIPRFVAKLRLSLLTISISQTPQYWHPETCYTFNHHGEFGHAATALTSSEDLSPRSASKFRSLVLASTRASGILRSFSEQLQQLICPGPVRLLSPFG